MNTAEEKAFNPNSHIIQIKSQQGNKDYLPVAWRLVWLRDTCPDAQIETELLHLDMQADVECEVSVWSDEKRKYERVIKRAKGVAVFKATVKTPSGATATGTKSENKAAFDDYVEKAETGAIGRALAALGYGTQFTGDELDEGTDRIADSPVERQQSRQSSDGSEPATVQQLNSVKNLQKLLGQEQTDLTGLSFNEVAALIKELSASLQAQKKRAS